MSGSIEERKLSDGNIRSVNGSSGKNLQQWEERFADEMVNIIENSPEKDLLISVLRDFVQEGKVPTQGLQVLNLVNSITTDITGSKLDEGDKKSLNDDFSKFRGLLPESGNWIDVKVSGGAYPRYRFILTSFFEAESKRQEKKFDNSSDKKQRLSHETYKIKRHLDKITAEKNLLEQSFNADLEIKAMQNEILQKTFKEIDQLHLIQQNEKKELSELNAERQAEQTRISDQVKNVEANLEQMKKSGQELINETKAQKASHFSATRKIAAKRQEVESLYNLEKELGPVQDEIRNYSQRVGEGEISLGRLRSELNGRLTEYNRLREELNQHLQNQKIQDLNRNLQEQINEGKEKKDRRITLGEELNTIREELTRIRNQSSVVDLDKSLQTSSAEIQRWQEIQTKNAQTQEELGTKCQKQKESIATLEKEIEALLENKIIEEQSLETLEKEAGEKRQFFERDMLDFKLYEKNTLSACKEIDTQIKQCDWKRIEKTQSFGSSFIYTLLLTIICSLFCVILYNLPRGTLYKLFEI